MGAVGSAAPWFLTGWADEMKMEFMIDTGCQVTILAASVFERMCASIPQVRAQLDPYERRLVSADSSPSSVGGRRSPAVACWASDHWVVGSNPLRGSFIINFASLSPASAWPSLA